MALIRRAGAYRRGATPTDLARARASQGPSPACRTSTSSSMSACLPDGCGPRPLGGAALQRGGLAHLQRRTSRHSPYRQRQEPRRRRRRGCDGCAGALLGNRLEGFRPPQTGCLWAPAATALLCPGPLFGFPLLAPSLELSRSHLQSFDGQRLRHHCWRFIAAGWPGPPGSWAISPSFQDAGRPHVNVGWRHPRPVAANDGRIVRTRHPHGDRQCRRTGLATCCQA